MTIESDRLIGSNNGEYVVTLPIRNKQGIGAGLNRKSSWLLKQRVVELCDAMLLIC